MCSISEFTLNGRQILINDGSGKLALRDVVTGDEDRVFEGAYNTAAISADGGRILTVSQGYIALTPSPVDKDKTELSIRERSKCILWNASTRQQIRIIEGVEGYVETVPLAFSPDGTRFFAASGTNACLWDTATGRLLREFRGHTERIRTVAFSPDGRVVLTGAADGTAILWDTATGQPQAAGVSNEAWSRGPATSAMMESRSSSPLLEVSCFGTSRRAASRESAC